MLFWEDVGLWGSSNNIPNDIFATLARMETNWEPRFPFSYQYQSFSQCDSSCESNSQLCTTEAFSHIINCSCIIPLPVPLGYPLAAFDRSHPHGSRGLHVAFLCGPSSSFLARITMPFAIMKASISWEQKLRCITELHAPKSKPASLSVSHVKTHAYRKEDSNRSSYNTQMAFLCHSFTFLFLYIGQNWQSLRLISTFTRKDKET